MNRNDFSVLAKPLRGNKIVYLDSGCMSLISKRAISAMNEFHENYPVCANRSVHSLGVRASEAFSKAREEVSRFIGAKKSDELIFTKNTTESINLIANSLKLKKGDAVITSDKEHNSNFLPWMILAERGIEHRVVKTKNDGSFDLDEFYSALDGNVRLVSASHVSNLDGSILPVKEVAEATHDAGGLVMLDGAQSAGHIPIDVSKMDVDLFAFSGHKMTGPSMGALYCREDVMQGLEPFMLGGGTVEEVSEKGFVPSKGPMRFEAGLQNYAGAIGMGAAANYLSSIGMEKIAEHDASLNSYLDSKVRDIAGIELLGPDDAKKRISITCFNVKGADPHQVGISLDEFANVMVRSGRLCVHSWFESRRIAGCVRASLYLYNDKKDVDIFAETLNRVAGIFSSI